VVAHNDRGWCLLRAVVTEDVSRGVAVAPKGFWPKLSPGKRNVNWTTSDGLTDFGLQAIYHSNMVRVRPATERDFASSEITSAAVAD